MAEDVRKCLVWQLYDEVASRSLLQKTIILHHPLPCSIAPQMLYTVVALAASAFLAPAPLAGSKLGLSHVVMNAGGESYAEYMAKRNAATGAPAPVAAAPDLAEPDSFAAYMAKRNAANGVVTPTAQVAAVEAPPAVSSEDAAKLAWLNRLEQDTRVPTPVAAVATPVAPVAEVATPSVPAGSEDAAKAAWLARLEQDAAPSEDAAKRQWLKKIEQGSWAAPVAAVAPPPVVAAAPTFEPEVAVSEDAAKQAWLERVEAPAWGQAAEALTEAAVEATTIADLSDKCDSGDHAACDNLLSEQEAKAAWLAKLDVPSWGQAAAKLSEAAVEATTLAQMTGKVVGYANLKMVDEATRASSSWSARMGVRNAAERAARREALSNKCSAGVDNACEELLDEVKLSQEAKSEWMSWAASHGTRNAAERAARRAALNLQCNSGVAAACETLSVEAEAKKQWLAKLDTPAWGKALV